MKKILGFMLLLLGLTFIVSCDKDTPVVEPPVEDETPTWKTVVLAYTENEGELRLKAEANGTVGVIYYILVKEGTAPTEPQIVAGVNYSSVTIVKKGNSGTTQLIEEVITGLENGVAYTAYYVIQNGTKYSTIQNRTTTTFKEVYKGLGTEADPFEISTIDDLKQVGLGIYETGGGKDWSKTSYYKLMNDIDLSVEYGEGKASWKPIQLNALGHFDGQNYKISGLYINVVNAEEDQGLFGTINTGAVVRNLVLENVYIKTDGYYDTPRDASGTNIKQAADSSKDVAATGYYTGSLTGSLKGQVYNCHVINTIIEAAGGRIGGLTGRVYTDEGTEVVIKDSSVINGDITGATRIGGIVGLVDSKAGVTAVVAKIENVIFTGKITGVDKVCLAADTGGAADGMNYSEYIGGIAGYFRSAIINNAVVNAEITATRMAGGIIGFMQMQSKGSKFATQVDNVLFKGTVHITNNLANLPNAQNSATIVSNTSTSNDQGTDVIKVGNNLYEVAGSEATFAKTGTRPATAIMGKVVVTSEQLTSEWFTTNMQDFTFDFNLVFPAEETPAV